MNVTMEVGCHLGQHIDWLRRSFNSFVYCFEPVPYLYQKLYASYKNSKDVEIINKAVDIKDEDEKSFYVCTRTNDDNIYGASSLYKFKEDICQKWPGRDDFSIGEVISVRTIRLDTFIKEKGIEKIRYLHCDTQGNDFNVLKSLGDNIFKVEEGLVEVVYDIPLYDGLDNDFKTVQNWLIEHGFVCDWKLNDSMKAEANIYFVRRKI